MRPHRPSRAVAAFITILSLLFTQFALAAYSCPGVDVSKPATMTMAGGDMADCASMDAEQTGLCHSYCQADSQSVDTAHAPLVQPFVAAALTLVVQAPMLRTSAGSLQHNAVSLKRSTAPPLAIRNCCYRI